jgi:hypothetical protein
MNESNESSWRDLYRAAVLESDSSLFRVRVNEALARLTRVPQTATGSRATSEWTWTRHGLRCAE